MAKYFSEEEQEWIHRDMYGKMMEISIPPIDILGETQDRTTLELQVEIIEYERRVSKRS